MSQTQRSAAEIELAERARKVLPAGTFGNTALDIVIARGKGGHVWDVSGNEYVDFLLGSGPMLVGHAHPKVEAAVLEQIPQRHDLLRQQPAWHPARRGDRRGGAVRRAGAVRVVGFRSRPLRDARRPRLHEARQDPEIRGRLSRHERLWPHEPRPEAARELPHAGAGFGGHSEIRARGGGGRAVQRSRGGGEPAQPARQGDRGDHRRAVPAADPAEAGLPRGPAQAHRAARHRADLRRGGDGLPLRLWRRAGLLRRDAGPRARSAR